jgi:magnesium transporter
MERSSEANCESKESSNSKSHSSHSRLFEWVQSKRTQKRVIGLPPGTMVKQIEPSPVPCELKAIYYSKDISEMKTYEAPEIIPERKPEYDVLWLNLIGLNNPTLLENIGRMYNLNSLILEDIVALDERPKIEFLEDEKQIYMVLKSLVWDKDFRKIRAEEISIIFGPNYVLTFQETPPDDFMNIIDRIRTGKGKIRKMGAAYLAYVQVDYVVDKYFPLLDAIGEHIAELDDRIMENPDKSILTELHTLKRDMIFLRRIVHPMREVIVKLEREQMEENELIPNSMRFYLRDLYDHITQINETIDHYRDILSNMLESYLSTMSNKLNDIMKVLTIISTVFIPLTLISGIYGMNFKYMPELEWQAGYPFAILLMIGIVIVEFYFFHRKGWLRF